MNDYTDTDKALEADAYFDACIEYEIAYEQSKIQEAVRTLLDMGMNKYDVLLDVLTIATESIKAYEIDDVDVSLPDTSFDIPF